MKRDRTTGLLFASSVLLLALSALTLLLAYRVHALAEAVADADGIRAMEECERCREKEAANWTAAIGRRDRYEACCWDLVETMSGKHEREVLESRCDDVSRFGEVQ